MFDYKKYLSAIAAVVLTAFTFTYAVPVEQAMAVEKIYNQLGTAQKNSSSGVRKPKTSLGSFADDLAASFAKMKASLEKSDITQFKKDLKETQGILKSAKKSVLDELDANEQALSKMKAKNASSRHQKLKGNINSKFTQFDGVIAKIDSLSKSLRKSDNADIEKIKGQIAEIEKLVSPEQPQKSLGSELPHDNVDVRPPSPPIGGGVSPAYLAKTSGTSASTLSKTPGVEDTTLSDETQATASIKSLADSLGTPINMYEYVRNNIKFETYYGSRKGAAGTLMQMSGNDTDQASLLISMLRYKNIPSRYVTGTVEIPAERVMNWTGATSPQDAAKALGSLGIPVTSIVSGGKIVSVQVLHTWVEAYVSYGNYRGTGTGNGTKLWIPLDASYKSSDKKAGTDILSGVAGKTELIAAADKATTISSDGNSITKIDSTELSKLVDKKATEINNYIKSNDMSKKSWSDIFGGLDIVPQKLGLLPNTLPYKTVTVTSEYRGIPDTLKDTVGFSIKGADPFGLGFYGDDDFSYKASASDLYNKKITLSWSPATDEDKAIIKNYGGLFKAPAYMVQLKPELKI
ncbi:MAG TPA: transglutaminase domain-containing protein, partial [Clostridia bacterium]